LFDLLYQLLFKDLLFVKHIPVYWIIIGSFLMKKN